MSYKALLIILVIILIVLVALFVKYLVYGGRRGGAIDGKFTANDRNINEESEALHYLNLPILLNDPGKDAAAIVGDIKTNKNMMIGTDIDRAMLAQSCLMYFASLNTEQASDGELQKAVNSLTKLKGVVHRLTTGEDSDGKDVPIDHDLSQQEVANKMAAVITSVIGADAKTLTAAAQVAKSLTGQEDGHGATPPVVTKLASEPMTSSKITSSDITPDQLKQLIDFDKFKKGKSFKYSMSGLGSPINVDIDGSKCQTKVQYAINNFYATYDLLSGDSTKQKEMLDSLIVNGTNQDLGGYLAK